MGFKASAKVLRNAAFSNAPAQTALRRGARAGWIPRGIYERILPIGPHPIATPAGHTIIYVADVTDAMARAVVWTDRWERSSLKVWSELAKTSRCIVDVGAYTGMYSLIAAADSNAAVMTIEPNRAIIPNLRRNIAINGFQDRVNVVEAAVSDAPGRASLVVPGEDPTSATIRSDHHGEASLQVDVTTLDEVVGAEPVDLIKLDVEGHELSALQGAEALLRRNQPDLVVELLSSESFQEVSHLLQTWGYRECRHLSSLGPALTRQYVREGYHANFHFVSPLRHS